jgi:hypothetical protein
VFAARRALGLKLDRSLKATRSSLGEAVQGT